MPQDAPQPDPSTPRELPAAGEPPTQRERDEAEWNRRANWKLGVVYFSHRDSRTWVPKRSTLGRRRMGLTPNLAKPAARAYLKVVLGAFLVLFLLVWILERLGVLR